MKRYLTFGLGKSKEPVEIEISYYETLLDLVDEFEIQAENPIPLDLFTYPAFRSYESFMNEGFIQDEWTSNELKPDLFEPSFLEISSYLGDQRFPQLLDWTGQQICLGTLEVDLRALYLKLIFESTKTYEIEEVAALLEHQKFRLGWSRLYPFFPIGTVAGLRWKIPLLAEAYEIPLTQFHLVEQPASWAPLDLRQGEYLNWPLRINLKTVVLYVIEKFKLDQTYIRRVQALGSAVVNNHSDLALYLVERFELNKEDLRHSSHYYLLRVLIKEGRLSNFNYLVQHFNLSTSFLQELNLLISALEGGRLEVLQFLKERNYLNRDQLTFNQNEAINIALRQGQLELIRYIHTYFHLCKSNFQPLNKVTIRQIIKGGHLDIIQYLHQEVGLAKFEFIPSALLEAAFYGQFEIFKYLVESETENLAFLRNQVSLSRDTILPEAAIGGHLDIIRYVVEELDLFREMTQQDRFTLGQIIQRAAFSGHLGIIQYFHHRGVTAQLVYLEDTRILIGAAGRGHLEILSYLHQEMGLTNTHARDTNAFIKALEGGYLEIIKYLHQKMGLTPNEARASISPAQSLGPALEEAVCQLAKIGRLDIIKYLHREIGFNLPDNSFVFSSALIGGQMEVITYLHQEMKKMKITNSQLRKVLVWDYLLFEVVKAGHLAVLEYLDQELDLRLTDFKYADQAYLIITAASEGQLEILQYLNKQVGSAFRSLVRSQLNSAFRMAAIHNQLATVQYLAETFNLTRSDARSLNNEALRGAAGRGHIDLFRYLVEYFDLTLADLANHQILKELVYSNRLEILRYIFEQMKLDPRTAQPEIVEAYELAASRERIDIVDYLAQFLVDRSL